MRRVALTAVVALGCGEVPPAPVASVQVTPGAVALVLGERTQLAAEVRLADGTLALDPPVAWTSADPGIAAVSETGELTAIGRGARVVISATSDDQTGTAAVTVTGPVATVAVTPALPPMIVGATATLTAELRDDAGALVTGRAVAWTSSDPAVIAVSAAGAITAVAVGGPVTITATADGHHGDVSASGAPGIITGIADIGGMVRQCPDDDPAFATIAADFQLRENGVLLAPTLACDGSFATVPPADFTDELIAYQVLRIAYHLSEGTAGRLPWTAQPLYAWMTAAIAGINFKTAPGQLYCCDLIEGRRYFSMSRLDAFNREQKRDWPGLASSLDFFLHEIRHTDGPGHTTGCPAFPSPTGPLGCDATYDLGYLGSYGVQYWLHAGWASGFLYIGLDCSAPDVASRYRASHVAAANDFITRFVTGAPPPVTAGQRYGGPCP